MLSRRDALKAAACTAALTGLPSWLRATAPGPRPYLEAALRAEQWIRSVAIATPAGRSWPATPGDPERGSPELSLYSGAPGVIMGYLELHAHTGEKRFLDEAVAGALDLASRIPGPGQVVEGTGLYEGLAGHIFVLTEVHKASGRDDIRAAALKAARSLAAAAPERTVTDIVSGSAGTGLALLGMRDLLGDQAIALARDHGNHLLTLRKPVTDGQAKWMMDPTFPREMPNFSHGTAGVAYFLARLSQQGGEPAHLDAAKDGARYLRAISVPSGSGSVIRHHDNDGANLFYLSWCHGGAGTGRLWNALFAIDHDPAWRSAEDAGARGIIAQGVPERRTAGFWNNISMCCGNSGVAEYFLDRWRRTHNPADQAYARRQADDLLRRGTEEGGAERWVQAENRVSPLDTAAQTGWMQGAAGVAAMLLHMDAASHGRPDKSIPFPDAS